MSQTPARSSPKRLLSPAFFRQHLLDLKDRLNRRCAPFDRQRATLHKRGLKKAVEQDADDVFLDSFFHS